MGGSSSKRPRPSYEDGELRDPDILAMQEEQAKAGDDQEGALRDLVRRVARPTPDPQ